MTATLAELLAVASAHGAHAAAAHEDDGTGRASVTYASPADAVTFLNLVTDEDTPELPDWTFEVEPVNRAPEDGGPPDHTLRITVRFPVEHIGPALELARAKPVPDTTDR